MSIEEKIRAIAQKVYHADDINILPAAMKQLKQLEVAGIWKSADLRRQDTVQLFRRSDAARGAEGLHTDG